MRTRLLPLVLLSLAACTEPDPEGALKVGIVSGNNQVSTAKDDAALGEPIVGQLVRLPNGQVAWQQKAIDAVLPAKAYAQSQTLNGAPVAGMVVCAASVFGNVMLVPVVPCTSTDVNGKATFAFTHGTKAGEAKAVVQGMLNGKVATYDTARAVVKPGALNSFGWSGSGFGDTTVTVGQVLDFQVYPLRASDKWGNTWAQSDYTFTSRRINSDPALTDPAPVGGWKVTVRAGDTRIEIRANGVGDSYITLIAK